MSNDNDNTNDNKNTADSSQLVPRTCSTPDRLHWYSYAFMDGLNMTSSFLGSKENRVTLKDIETAKTLAGTTNTAIMLSCCYLGFMTPVEFNESVYK